MTEREDNLLYVQWEREAEDAARARKARRRMKKAARLALRKEATR